ncbi:hypothetical protein HFE03_03940 [Paenibacillus sp. EKM102P]|uniref:hypothetical protein n=1 Tax=unclassified Paenibacillus TaxID=185978 RepID=UPI00142DCCE8|nr:MULTISPECIES: hypothetical protein [unclassified Paenibacillus]KAF6618359.1 hypothetical protein HFE00_09775 [Paenibacillus sp. EKM101P]KAF6624705.1 hypothetical protein HFE03_03940 [Paenibacillus sp. EKM102P]KAF6635516.1 hypothetical protein HFE01_01095 [Paenibacillus sp. EKM10P]KAF6648775.1 hypothetical protein HFE02_10460 [Paenibacillus sp. EKM11P]
MNKETELGENSPLIQNNARKAGKAAIHLDIRNILLQCGITTPEWLNGDVDDIKCREDKRM